MTVDLALQFATHACELPEERVPAEVLARTKALILDTLGAAFAGSGAEGIAPGLVRRAPTRSPISSVISNSSNPQPT